MEQQAPQLEPGEAPSRAKWLVALVVGIGTLLSALAGSAVALALPEIGRELGVSIGSASWVMEAYLLAVTVLLLPAGRASDLLGHRAVYVAGFLLFGVASLACGLAPSFGLMVAARLLQGGGGALLMAAAPALLTTSFPSRERGRALGIVSTATYAGLTAGPPLGGALIAGLGWRWVFFLNVPTAALIVALGLAVLPRPTSRKRGVAWDPMGILALSAGLPVLLVAVVEGPTWGWLAPRTLALALGGLALLAGFTLLEKRVRAPLLHLELFRSRVFTGAVLSAIANYVALFVPIFLLPFGLREGLGLTPGATGAFLAVQPFVMALVASPSGWLSDRVGTRWLATSGMALLAVGLVGLSTLREGFGSAATVAWLAVMGLGTGVFISPNSSALMGAAPRAQQGVAGGVLAVARNLGMMAGVALAVSLFRALGGRTGHEWSALDFEALRACLAVAAGVAALGAVAAALRGRRAERDGPPAGDAG